ncbi:MAG: transporter substrate-binding domain-containing protein [Rhizobacter sp.]|nr:transporter substrate-binding domain-containing protein [Burkholderiales bacterium]
MNKTRRRLFSLLVTATALLAGCNTLAPSSDADTEARRALAPTGVLRAGVYAGSPTSMIVDAKSGQKIGIAHDLGRELARQLKVPFEVVEFRLIAEVLAALKIGAVDFTFTNATAARASDVDFTAPMLQLELGYIVLAGSKITTLADVDQTGNRIGVSEGSSSQGTLSRQFKRATIVAAPSLKAAREMLAQGKLDAFATNKAVLSEFADQLPATRILDGRWGVENMAIAIPKGRERGMTTLRAFAEQVKANGLLQSIVKKTGLRGLVKTE